MNTGLTLVAGIFIGAFITLIFVSAIVSGSRNSGPVVQPSDYATGLPDTAGVSLRFTGGPSCSVCHRTIGPHERVAVTDMVVDLGDGNPPIPMQLLRHAEHDEAWVHPRGYHPLGFGEAHE